MAVTRSSARAAVTAVVVWSLTICCWIHSGLMSADAVMSEHDEGQSVTRFVVYFVHLKTFKQQTNAKHRTGDV